MAGKKHDAVFDEVPSGIDTADVARAPRSGARFLKRSTSIGERLAGDREEKVLHWVDPDACRMRERHNREYALLTEDNCRDLIGGIFAHGRQEFPAIVRHLEGGTQQYEAICGARRHFAVSWLRANNYPQFRYLVEVRDLTNEEAFRLTDIENRDRDDISDYERARDYAQAIELYYGGKQKAMAARLEVSEVWLSRYLGLARLPEEIAGAFASIRDLKELHARMLKPLLAKLQNGTAMLAAAAAIARDQATARAVQGVPLEPAQVLARLKAAASPMRSAKASTKRYPRSAADGGISTRRSGNKTVLEVPDVLLRAVVEVALAQFVADRFRES